MQTVQVVEAKARFSALLAVVEAGETVVIMRRGRVVARLVPEVPRTAADLFRPLWDDPELLDLVAPEDPPPQPVVAL